MIKKLTIKKYLEMVEKKQIVAKELIEEMEKEYLKLKHLNIFVEPWFEEAKQLAEKNHSLIPMGLKDLYLYKGKKITAASKMLKNFISPYTSTVVSRLLDHNAVFVGSLNMDEFAAGGTGTHSCYGATISPWKNAKGEEMCVGGSGSGSAAAVCADLCLAATSSDTGGSIRCPAAYTGLVGLKPTYGVLSRYGVIPFAHQLDCPGYVTKTVEDCEFLFSKTIGFDHNDFTSVEYVAQKSNKIAAVCIPDNADERIKIELEKCAKILEKNGYKLKHIQIDHLEYSVPCYYILAPAELASNLNRYNGIFYGDPEIKIQDIDDLYTKTRSECFGEEIQRRVVIGNFTMYCGNVEGFYNKARRILSKIWKNLKPTLDECDVILIPGSHTPAPTIAELNNRDPVTVYMEDTYMGIINMLGLPGMAVPTELCHREKMPIGIQIISKPFGENLIFDTAKIIEAETRFFEKYSWRDV